MITEEIANIVTEPQEIFYESAEFWTGVSFVLVVVCIYRPVARLIKGLINQRISHIKNELQEAETLKLDSQKLYAESQRKFLNIENEVAEIIENQKKNIEQIKEKKIKDLNTQLNRRKKEAEGLIEKTYAEVSREISMICGKRVLKTLKQLIRLKLNKSDYNKLIDTSISHIENLEFSRNE